jgi:hypothetical protein
MNIAGIFDEEINFYFKIIAKNSHSITFKLPDITK